MSRDQSVPRHHGQIWTAENDRFLAENFHFGAYITNIASVMGRTELAIRYRLMYLGLRDDWELREFDKKRGKTTLPPLDPDPSGTHHAHHHEHRGYGVQALDHYHYHDAGHHLSEKVVFVERRDHHVHQHTHGRRRLGEPEVHVHRHFNAHHKGERSELGNLVTSQYTGPLWQYDQLQAKGSSRTIEQMKSSLDKRNHTHVHKHPPVPLYPSEDTIAEENHSHDHVCGHHQGERSDLGNVVSSRYTGPLWQYKPRSLEERAYTGTITGRLSTNAFANIGKRHVDLMHAIGDSPGVDKEREYAKTMDFVQVETREARDWSAPRRKTDSPIRRKSCGCRVWPVPQTCIRCA